MAGETTTIRPNNTTEVDVVLAKIRGGVKPKGHGAFIKNIWHHSAAKELSRGMFWVIECDMNDSSVGHSVRQAKKIWNFWENFKKRLELGKDNSDGPTTNLTFNHKVMFPTPVEQLKNYNARLWPCMQQWTRAILALVDDDDSAMQTNVGEQEDIKDVIKEAENVMIAFLGDYRDAGKPIEPSIHPEPNAHLGDLNPDTDFDEVEIEEGSARRINKGLLQGDAPDEPGNSPE